MKKVNYSDIIAKEYDLFICSSSFEKRCLQIASNISVGDFKQIIICHFEDNYLESNQNLEALKNLFHGRAEVLLLLKNDPLTNFDRLASIIQEYSNCKKTLLDISTFTREVFLIILRIFSLEPFKINTLFLCYNLSSKYSNTSIEQIEKLWLSKGVNSIRSILGYSGDLSPIKKLMLIVLVGFEAERSQIIIDNFEPDKLYIGLSPSKNSINPEIATINKYNFERLRHLNPEAVQFEFTCTEVCKTVDILSEIVTNNKGEFNIVICPMNNKISTLAVASIGFKYPEVQICYSSTNQYNIDGYSTSSDEAYLIEAKEIYGELIM